MSGSAAFHIVREEDGTSTGLWGSFVLKSAFQPIFAFHGGRLELIACEALLRPYAKDELLPPPTFFGSLTLADRIAVENLAHGLHLRNACASVAPDKALFLNFDPSVFTDHAVAEASIRGMRVTLAETGIDPHRIVCEVTEKATVSQEALYTLVTALRASGFRIAVDDYGVDDSDIARIRELDPDIVKFDGGWIARLMDSGAGYALLATMVASFAEQGIRTVFEGIEEGWQLELAEKAGVDMVQGFALARPELAPAKLAWPTAQGSADRPPERPAARAARGTSRAARPSRAFGRRSQPQ